MQLAYYVAALVLIGFVNWAVARSRSRRTNKLTFFATAGAPIALWIGLMAYLLARDGLSTFESPYFSLLLMVVGGCTVATSAAALAGQALGRKRPRRQH